MDFSAPIVLHEFVWRYMGRLKGNYRDLKVRNKAASNILTVLSQGTKRAEVSDIVSALLSANRERTSQLTLD